METPDFFRDETKKDREFCIVYWISWTVRCAVDCNEHLKGYPKKVLLKLLGLEDTNDIVIESVKSWKE